MTAERLRELRDPIEIIRAMLVDLYTLEHDGNRKANLIRAKRETIAAQCHLARDAAGPWLLEVAKQCNWPDAAKWYWDFLEALSPPLHFGCEELFNTLLGQYMPNLIALERHARIAEGQPAPANQPSPSFTGPTTPTKDGLARVAKNRPGRCQRDFTDAELTALDEFAKAAADGKPITHSQAAKRAGMSIEETTRFANLMRKRASRAADKPKS